MAQKQRGASINFQPIKNLAFSLSHAFRKGKPPSYVFKGAAASAGVCAPVLELGHSEIKRRHAHRMSQNKGQSKNSAVFWEGVINLPAFNPPLIDGAPCPSYTCKYKEETDARLQAVSRLLRDKYGLYVMACVTHLDEGHYDKETGKPVYNPHAHLIVDRRGFDVTNIWIARITRAELKQIQTDIAALMGMPRGKSGGRRMPASEFRELKRLEEKLHEEKDEALKAASDAQDEASRLQQQVADLQVEIDIGERLEVKAREEKDEALKGWSKAYKAWEAVCVHREEALKAASDAQDEAFRLRQQVADLQVKADEASRLQQQVADLQAKADEGARALQGAQEKVVRLQQTREKLYRREIRARMVASGGYGPRDYQALSRLSGDALKSKLAEFESWWRRLDGVDPPTEVDWNERPLFGAEPDPDRPSLTLYHWEDFLVNLRVSNSPFESRERAQPQPATEPPPPAPAQAQPSAEEQRQRRTDLPSPFGRPFPSPFGMPSPSPSRGSSFRPR